VVRSRVEERGVVHGAAREAVREAAHGVGREAREAVRGAGRGVRVAGPPDAVLDAGAGDLVERMRDSREERVRQEVPGVVLVEDLRDPAAVLRGLATFLMFCERSGFSCTCVNHRHSIYAYTHTARKPVCAYTYVCSCTRGYVYAYACA
jgi:hypothetical protein